MNITITVPVGSSNHGNPHLLCTPPSWYDYIVFYFSNYFAHAATVITVPGQGRKETLSVILGALLLPGSGVTRALAAIMRCSRFESDPLKRAARAGALCMVIRVGGLNPPAPEAAEPSALEEGVGGSQESPGEEKAVPKPRAMRAPGNAVTLRARNYVDSRPWWDPTWPERIPEDAVVHGQYRLPTGYALAFVPSNAARRLKSLDNESCEHLVSSYNFPKIMISFIQAIWAIITLYRARGDQIQQFGYAAFGLTVTPYAFMSVMNILGSLLNPEYAALFLLRTPLMSTAESEGGFFAADVAFGAETSEPMQKTGPRARMWSRIVTLVNSALDLGKVYDTATIILVSNRLGVLVGCIPLAVIGGLSKFQAQDSSALQRGFTMAWVVLGILGGPVLRDIAEDVNDVPLPRGKRIAELLLIISMTLVAGAASIGGMVVVGLMIRGYGICTLLS